LGRKKKLLTSGGRFNPRLIRSGLPIFRRVQSAEEQLLLDEIGEFVIRSLGLAVGPIEGTDRQQAVNKIVEFLYLKLEGIVVTLSPDRLLEWLVCHDERVVYEDAFARFSIPARTACYSSVPKMVQEFQEEYGKRSSAHISSRFLIEYVAARPPNGQRPISLSIYDELLAIAWQLVNFGNVSDALRYKLADRPIAMLESGRLAIGRSAYEEAHDAFLGEFSYGLVGRSMDAFDGHWRVSGESESRGDEADFRQQVDDATECEFGIKYSELIDFLVEVLDAGLRRESEPKVAAVSDLLDEANCKLNWDRSKLQKALDHFAAYPRADFMKPPPPSQKQDVYPWRHNRALSYFRKPLLLRRTSRGDEVVWGSRNLTIAAEYLAHLCLDARLNATAKPMRDLVHQIHDRDGAVFNDRVAELFEFHDEFIVRRRVEKVGRLSIKRPNGEDLGDVDVLVAIPRERRVLAIETKDLAVSLTPFEVWSELRELFGDGIDKSGKISIHLERVEWLRAHLGELLGILGLPDDATGWIIEPKIVFDRELVSPYVAKCVIPVMSYRRLREELARTLDSL